MSEWSVNLKATKDCRAKNAGNIADADSMISRIAAGDTQAFENLIASHGDSIARLIGRLTAWHADSDDILQDVFLTVWQQAGSFDGRGSIEGWIKRIAINRCRNHFRALSSLRRKLERFVGFGLMKPIQQYDSNFEIDDANEHLRSQIEKLGKHDRLILVLYYLEDMSGEDLAELMKIKLETLHVQLHRARRRLKNLIAEQNHD